jgi:hypothetical protein
MFRSIACGVSIAILASCLFLAGCSNPPKPEEVPTAGEETPSKTVELLFSAFTFGDMTGTGKLFSKKIPSDMASKFTRDFFKKHAIDQFKPKVVSQDKKTAVVKVIYSYLPKDEKGEPVDTAKKKVELKTMGLVKEGDSWKIRKTGFPDFDEKVEENIFYECMNIVMDVTIAEEKLRQLPDRDAYTNELALLNKILPINEAACKSISVTDADGQSYLVVATSRNTPPCNIEANTDMHKPEKFEDCRSGSF